MRTNGCCEVKVEVDNTGLDPTSASNRSTHQAIDPYVVAFVRRFPFPGEQRFSGHLASYTSVERRVCVRAGNEADTLKRTITTGKDHFASLAGIAARREP